MPHNQQSNYNMPNPAYIDESMGFNADDDMDVNGTDIWSLISNKLSKFYDKATNAVDDEFPIPISQKQINDALEKFVTRNVKQILELRIELHDGWFRLYCTVDAAGIYAEVAANFGLVHAQIDKHVQRFVFAQQSNTDVIKLRCESFLKLSGIKLFIWLYHSVLKKDPLAMILNKINITRSKENILYLDIGRWLKKNKKIMSTLHKVQFNYGIVEEEQLVLKTQVNVRNLLLNKSGEEIITLDDEPESMKGELHPIDDAVTPSQEQQD